MFLLTFTMPDIWPDLVITLVIGAVSGWIASIIMNTKGGLLRNIIIGLIGSVVGRFVLQLVGEPLGIKVIDSNPIGTIIVSVLGACIFVWLIHKLVK